MPEVLERFQRAIGFGEVKGPSLADGKEPLYRWDVSSRSEVLATYLRLRPWLGEVKRSQFEHVLELLPWPAPREPAMTHEESVAWCAGLFDGEGSTCLVKHGSHYGYFVLEANITQSSRRGRPEVLARFKRVINAGDIYGPYPSDVGHAPVYRWRAYPRDDIERLIARMRPYLGEVKRSQASVALGVVSAQAALPRGNPAWGNRKARCIRGHDYETARVRPFRSRGKNIGAPRASHQCLACVREAARARRAKHRTKAAR
jgi:hypothetical protein